MKKAILIYFLMHAFIYVNAQSYTITPNNTVLANSASIGVPVIVGMQTGRSGTIEFRRGGAIAAGIQNNVSTKQLRIGVFHGAGNDSYRDIVIDSATHFVGINTPSANPPLARFHVFDGASGVTPSSNAKIFIEDNTHTYLNFGTPDNADSGILFGKASFGSASGGIIYTASRNLQFRTSTNDTRMTITEAGNVGVGISAPAEKLDVNGSINVADKIVRPSSGSGANLLPIAYGRVFCNASNDCSRDAGTSNWSLTKLATGHWAITVTGEELNRPFYTQIVSITDFSNPGFINGAINISTNNLEVKTYNTSGSLATRNFSFVIYKND